MKIKLPRLLPELAAFALLAVGLALLVPATSDDRPPAAAATASPSLAEPAAEAASAAPSPAPTAVGPVPGVAEPSSSPAASTPPASPAAPEVMPSGVAAAGDGPAGDPAVQSAFSKERPSDLAPADTEHLVALAREVWIAETTGAGRGRWPQYFPAATGAGGRLYLYTGVRVQAAAAHSLNGATDKARVDLLWVGTSPTGEYGDHRPATLIFTRATTGWEPVR